MTRRELYAQLQEEVVEGWPAPFWPQDAPRPDRSLLEDDRQEALCRYICLLAQAVDNGR